MEFEIEFYEKDGKEPVKDFILLQDNKMQAKIFHNLELLEIYGNSLREPYSKHLDDGISFFEIIKIWKKRTRIL